MKLEYPDAKQANGKIEDAYEAVKLLGYEFLSAGSFGRVYTKPDCDHVVKIGRANTDSYFKYVLEVGLNSENPHFPKFSEVTLYDHAPDTAESAPFYVVVVEKLEEKYEEMSKYWMANLGTKHPAKLDNWNIDYVKPKTDNMMAVKDLLKHMYTTHCAVCDIGGGEYTSNVMWRGETAVFTDPVV